MVFMVGRCGVIKWVNLAWIASGLGVAGSGMLHRSLDLTPTRLALIPSPTMSPSSGGGGGGGGGGFCDWVEASSPDAVSGLWMEIIAELEERRALKDYHLTILPTKAFESIGAAMGMGDLDEVPFLVIATHSIKRKGPASGPCMSCDLDLPIAKGVCHAPEPGKDADRDDQQSRREWAITTRDTVIGGGEEGFANYFDAKARDMLVVCPSRHVERISELSSEEIYRMCRSIVGALRSTGVSDDESGTVAYETLILNQGRFQNLPHLHVKCWLSPRDFDRVRRNWTDGMRSTFELCDAMFGRHCKREKDQELRGAPACGHAAMIIDRLPPGSMTGPDYDEALRRISSFGEVNNFRVNGRVGSVQCCGVAQFEMVESAAAAIVSMHGSPFGPTRRLRVEWASPCFCEVGDERCGEDSLVY